MLDAKQLAMIIMALIRPGIRSYVFANGVFLYQDYVRYSGLRVSTIAVVVIIVITFVYGCFAHIYICIIHIPVACRVQKMASGPLD